MTVDRRRKDWNWAVVDERGNNYPGASAAELAVLMDIRDELKALNRVFGCVNFQRIPSILDDIALDARRRNRLKRIAAAKKRAATMKGRKAA